MKMPVANSPVLKQMLVRKQARVLAYLSHPEQLAAMLEAPVQHQAIPVVSSLPTDEFDQGFAAGHVRGHEAGFESGRQEGMKQGYAAGMRQAGQDAQRQLDAKIHELDGRRKRLEQLHDAMAAELDRWCRDSESELVAIVQAAVLRILGKTMQEDQGVAGIVRQALAQVRDTIQLRMHPEDIAAWQQQSGSCRADWPVELVADEEVLLGGCLIRTPNGTLDARLESQLRVFTDLLLEVRSRRRERG